MSNFDRIIDRYGTNSAKWDSFIQGKKENICIWQLPIWIFALPKK